MISNYAYTIYLSNKINIYFPLLEILMLKKCWTIKHDDTEQR